MIQRQIQLGIIVMTVLSLVLSLLAACGDDGDNVTPKPTGISTPTVSLTPPAEDVTITVGYITDLTGPASTALVTLNMLVEDVIDYYNQGQLIPGVTIDLLAYDGQYDPSRDIPGYEWLKEQGADVILTQVPHTVATLKSRVEGDQMMLFSGSASLDDLQPPGYVFSMGTIPRHEAFTLLQWIAENDWDYGTKGPAKIGLAGHNDTYTNSVLDAMKKYVEIHPDQFEWVGGHLSPIGTFTWVPEVAALKDCDYLFAPGIMTTFVKELRNAGSSTKLIGTDIHLAFLTQVYDARLWDEIDDMLFIRGLRWWNEEGTFIDFTKELLRENHPDDAQEIMREGSGGLSTQVPYVLVNIIAQAAAKVGPQHVNSAALYEAAQSFSLVVDGVERFSFSETKRYLENYLAVYEARDSEEDLFRLSDWIPVVLDP